MSCRRELHPIYNYFRDYGPGISGLANVGYSTVDFERLGSLEVATNRFNLFTRLEDAVKFAPSHHRLRGARTVHSA